ncbi:MAG: hypothetical protein AAF693_21435 [Bacteroidota bacterium]
MRLIPILILVSTIASAQQVDYEQRVLQHFFENVFPSKYESVSSIEFDGCTEDELSNFTLFKNCFDLSDETISALDKKAYKNTFPKKKLDLTEINDISFKKKKTKSNLRMYFYQANESSGKHYLILGIVKQKHLTHNYYYELDGSGEVLQWCDTGMTH